MEPRLRVDIPRMTPDPAFIDRLAAVAASAPPAPAAAAGPRRVLVLAVAAGSVAAIVAGVAYAAQNRSDGLPPAHPAPVVRPSQPAPRPGPQPAHVVHGHPHHAPPATTHAPGTAAVPAATGNVLHSRTTAPAAVTHQPTRPSTGTGSSSGPGVVAPPPTGTATRETAPPTTPRTPRPRIRPTTRPTRAPPTAGTPARTPAPPTTPARRATAEEAT